MLDLGALSLPIAEAGRREKEKRERAARAVETAVREVRRCADDWESEHVPRLRRARTGRMFAYAPQAVDCRTVLPQPPEKHSVVAVDGSQIVPDRHSGLSSFYLLNIGQVVLRYGTGARPTLGCDGELELVGAEADDDEEAERQALRQVALLRFRREVECLATLATYCAEQEGQPTVALVDGSLIAWFFNSKENSAEADDAAKLEALGALMAAFGATRDAGVPFVGYVSRPGSRDVVAALSTTLCAQNPKVCHRRCEFADENRPCHAVLAATDAELFGKLLQRGERSPVFTSQHQETGQSHVLKTHYDPEHWICFFYLNVGSEVARVEFPCWVGADESLLNLVHAVCYDQAQKGQGFPVALIEAHEQAVVRQADREAFLHLLQRAMVREGATHEGLTRKALSKRNRPL